MVINYGVGGGIVSQQMRSTSPIASRLGSGTRAVVGRGRGLRRLRGLGGLGGSDGLGGSGGSGLGSGPSMLGMPAMLQIISYRM